MDSGLSWAAPIGGSLPLASMGLAAIEDAAG
jgi:hypothetical protein